MTLLALAAHKTRRRLSGPLLLCILDGVGLGPGDAWDAVAQAKMPTLRRLMAVPGRACALKAHGTAVGLPSDDDMGNSEVGHNALGSGRIVQQGAALVDAALKENTLFSGAGWQAVQARLDAGGTLHLMGLLSDGGVHSRLDQIFGLIDGAVARGCRRLRLHVLLDGRDVPDGSADTYLRQVDDKAAALALRGVDLKVASGGGRMNVTMDRYESDWRIVERGWRAHVLGDGPPWPSAQAAIAAARAQPGGCSDQHLPPFVVVDEAGRPVGPIADGDAVVFANFRGDRALQISRAFDDDDFRAFDRGRRPDVVYAGLMQYDGDLHVPKTYLVAPPAIDHTSGEYLAATGLRTFACSETQKYGHVTYFWNGNRSGAFDDDKETYLEIPSNPPPFERKPAMKAHEIAAAAIEALRSGRYDVVRVNLANGDMVGHTGQLDATIAACAAADEALTAMLAAVDEVGGAFVVTADHGNADDMAQRDKMGRPLVGADGAVLPKTSHTLSPVPLCIGGPALSSETVLRHDVTTPGLANVAATVIELLGFVPPPDYERSLLT
jgi:2,3-bisphosphoglycerate-independent phosphoglycerate mutase